MRCYAFLPVFFLLACANPTPTPDRARYPHLFDLAAELSRAQVLTETHRIDFGTPESHESLLDGWSGDGVYGDGSTFSWSLADGGSIVLHVLIPRDLEATMRLRPYRIDGPPQHVILELGDKELGHLELRGGMHTYQLTLPGEVLKRGRNVLRLRNVYPPNPPPGPPDLGPPGTAWDFLELATGSPPPIPYVSRGTLVLPAGTELIYHLEIDRDTQLLADRVQGRPTLSYQALQAPSQALSVLPAHLSVDHPTLIRLTLSAPETVRIKNPSLVSVAPITPTAQRTAPKFLPRMSRLEWDRSPKTRPQGLPNPKGAKRSRLAGGSPASDPIPTGPPRNVILYVIDTLRADHLSLYGYPHPTSPRLDAFASNAITVEQAIAQSSWTRSAVASILTGLGPAAHGVQGRTDALSPQANTLAEILHGAGHTTAAFITNGNVGQAFGFAQGFDTFELLGEHKGAALHASAKTLHEAALAWLGQSSGPFLLYLHAMEPHAPYAPPPTLARRFPAPESAPLDTETQAALDALAERRQERYGPKAARPEPGSMTWVEALDSGLLPSTEARAVELRALYDAEIRAWDRQLGLFLDRLEDLGHLGNTVIVVVSDHGEEFLDHGGWEHGRTLYQEQIRVPLILHLPGGPSGMRLGQARQIDLLPTLLDTLEIPIPQDVEGRSLLPRLQATIETNDETLFEPSYAHLDLDGHFAESLVLGRWKLLCGNARGLGCALYDLEADPAERNDLSQGNPVLAGYLHQELRAVRSGAARLGASEAEVDSETTKRLRALGYLD